MEITVTNFSLLYFPIRELPQSHFNIDTTCVLMVKLLFDPKPCLVYPT